MLGLGCFETKSCYKLESAGIFTFCGHGIRNQNIQRQLKVAFDCNQRSQRHMNVGIDCSQWLQ